MTATINIPEKLYKQADETARLLGVSNMQLFVIAMEQYLRECYVSNEKPIKKQEMSKEEFSPSVKSMLDAFKMPEVSNMSLYYKDEINSARDEKFRKKGFVD